MGYNKYEINTEGMIKHKKTGHILKNTKRKDGYYQVGLPRKEYIHVLIGKTFLQRLLKNWYKFNVPNRSCTMIAKIFKVSYSTITKIKNSERGWLLFV